MVRQTKIITVGMVLAAGSISPLASRAGAVADATTKEAASAKAPAVKPMLRVEGRVIDEDGRGVAGAHIKAWAGNSHPAADSAAEGRFELKVSQGVQSGLTLRATSDDGARQAYFQVTDAELLPPLVMLVLRPTRRVPVKVVDAQQEPVAGAWTAAMAYWFDVMDEATTDKKGTAILRVPADASLQYVIGGKPGVGLDYHVFRRRDELPDNAYKLPPDHHDSLTMVLNGTRGVKIRVVDERSQPLPNETVYPWYFEKPNKGDHLNTSGVPWFQMSTDGDGRADCDVLPIDNTTPITFWVRSDERVLAIRPVFDPRTDDAELTATLLPRVPVKGRVTFADGRPAAGAEVDVAGKGYQIDDYRESVRAGDDGTFEVRAYPDQLCLFAARLDRQASAIEPRVVRLGRPLDNVVLVLQKGTRIHGRVTLGSDPQPDANQTVTLYMHRDDQEYLALPKAEQLPPPDGNRNAITPRLFRHARIDDHGNFELFVGPGHYYLFGPQRGEPPQFVVTDEDEVEVNLHAERPNRVPFKGRVVLESAPSEGVKGARVAAVALENYAAVLRAVSGNDGWFHVERTPCAMFLYARSADESLAAVVPLAAIDTDAVIPLGPAVSAKGRLVDADTGQPLAKRRIDFGLQVNQSLGSFSRNYFGAVTTDERGDFQLRGMVPVWDFFIEITAERDKQTEIPEKVAERVFHSEIAETIDLGDIEVPAKPRKAD